MTDDATATDGPPREVRTARETGRGSGFGSVSRGRFDVPIEDVWALFADPERMRRWNPDTVAGEFRLGGRFSIVDNASGEILRCQPPNVFRVSWIYEDTYSELEVRLASVGPDSTVVEIEHIMKAEDTASAGMSLSDGLVAAGMGWDMSLDYLGRYLRGELAEPPSAGSGQEPPAEDLERYGQFEQAWQDVVRAAADELQ